VTWVITAPILWSTWDNARGLGAGAVITVLRGLRARRERRPSMTTATTVPADPRPALPSAIELAEHCEALLESIRSTMPEPESEPPHLTLIRGGKDDAC
jgi:hypothetical protein